MLYAGADSVGTHRVLLATSDDLYDWTKYASNPVIDVEPSPSWDHAYAGTPSAVQIDGSYICTYQGQSSLNVETRIGMAYSDDMINWQKAIDNPVFIPSDSGWDSEIVGQGGLILDEYDPDKIYMVYIAHSAGETVYSVGLAIGRIHRNY